MTVLSILCTALAFLAIFLPQVAYRYGYRNGWRDCDTDMARKLAPLQAQLTQMNSIGD